MSEPSTAPLKSTVSCLSTSTSTSRRCVVEKVTVLGDRTGKDHEVDLTVVIDSHNPHNGDRLGVSGQQHATYCDTRWITGGREKAPSVPVVVLRVQVGGEVDFWFHGHGRM